MTEQLKQIPLKSLKPWPGNPRKDFPQAELEDLALSMQTSGLIAPLMARPKGRAFEVVAGERRLRALKLRAANPEDELNDDSPIAVVVRKLDDVQALEIAVAENVERQALHPLDEAQAFEDLRKAGRTVEQVAAAIGRKRRYVEIRRQYLERLAAPAKKAFRDGAIGPALARTLVMECPKDRQEKMVKEIAKGTYGYQTVSQVADRCAQHSIPLSVALFPRADYKGPIGADPDELPEGLEADLEAIPDKLARATDPEAFIKLQRAAIEALAAKHKGEGWSWVNIAWPGDHFYRYGLESSDDKTVAGVCIDVDNDWSVEVHKGVVLEKDKAKARRAAAAKKGGAKGQAAAAEGDAEAWQDQPTETWPQQAGMHLAAQRKTQALREAMIADGWRSAMIATVASILGSQGGSSIHSGEGYWFADANTAIAGALKPLAAKLGIEQPRENMTWRLKHGRGSDYQSATVRLVEALAALKDEELCGVFTALVAERVAAPPRWRNDEGDPPLPRALAALLEVDLVADPEQRLDAAFLDTCQRPAVMRCAIGTKAASVEDLGRMKRAKVAELRKEVLAVTQADKPPQGSNPGYLPPCFAFLDAKAAVKGRDAWRPRKDQP